MSDRIGLWVAASPLQNFPGGSSVDYNLPGNSYFVAGAMKGDVVVQVLGFPNVLTSDNPVGLSITPSASDIILNLSGAPMVNTPAAGSVINSGAAGSLYGQLPYADLTQYFSPNILQDNMMVQTKRMPILFLGSVVPSSTTNLYVSPAFFTGIAMLNSTRIPVSAPQGANVRDVDWHPQTIPGA